RFAKAFPDGIPGLLSPQSIKNVLEFDVRVPIKIKEDIPPEKVLSFRLMREVQELSLSAAHGARSAINHVFLLPPTLLVFVLPSRNELPDSRLFPSSYIRILCTPPRCRSCFACQRFVVEMVFRLEAARGGFPQASCFPEHVLR